MASVHVECRWRSVHTIDVPEGMSEEEFKDSINNSAGDSFVNALDEINSSTAELTDWEAK